MSLEFAYLVINLEFGISFGFGDSMCWDALLLRWRQKIREVSFRPMLILISSPPLTLLRHFLTYHEAVGLRMDAPII